MDAYALRRRRAPPTTANPSLWRQAQLLAIHGLFEVAPGFYQVRGFDLSNMHLIEGETGVIVADPLISTETAAAALALYRKHRGDRPVTGLIYSHSHVDHFGGARGILSDEEIEAGTCPIIAPVGLHRARGERERLRGHRDGPARRLHVRRAARGRAHRPAHRRPRPDDVDRHGDAGPADAST